MVIVPALGLAASLLLGLAATADEPAGEVGPALGKGSFPWYDARNDRVRPFALPRPPSEWKGWNWSIPGLGSVVAALLFAAGLAALLALLAWFWRLYEPLESSKGPGAVDERGGPSRIEALPPGLRREFESTDPWSEATRRRDRGDLSGAVICLFAHQLLTLSGLGLVRLAPGRTGRQLLRSVADAEFRGLASPTLRLFEAAYYGHRPPTPGEFAALWDRAEAFERRVAGRAPT